jgi:transposase
VDRRKPGCKHNIITDANGVPLAVILTPANRYDGTQLIPLVNAVPPVRGRCGRPRCRPDAVQGDAGYCSKAHARWLRSRHIHPLIPVHRMVHGSGLGTTRWVVERTLSWLHQFRRLRVRYERRADMHYAFAVLGCAIICWRQLAKSFC